MRSKRTGTSAGSSCGRASPARGRSTGARKTLSRRWSGSTTSTSPAGRCRATSRSCLPPSPPCFRGVAPTNDSSLALAHDYLLTMRGAERTFAEMAACWPKAPIYTLLYDAEAADGFAGRQIHTSALQRLGVGQRGFRYLLPFFPGAAERLPVQTYETIVTSSSAFAHGLRPGPGALHVCYCH